jgi:hypothetical protein
MIIRKYTEYQRISVNINDLTQIKKIFFSYLPENEYDIKLMLSN